MEKKIASVISYISHPLLMPMVGLLVISNSGTYAADLDHRFTNFIYLSTFLLTFMIPVALMPLLILYGNVRKHAIFAKKGTVASTLSHLVFLHCSLFPYPKTSGKPGLPAFYVCSLCFGVACTGHFVLLENQCTPGWAGEEWWD